ncbi:hypothetical protein EC9_06040 [Rosistilla ulvae]|uniref:Uncharacterized protein n=1 Tax=Rosistilla ulvae TaxID=1930277 RepID=A0A517LUZ6_9BACT|nr:hypothetical protein EC9_06040 [Rosistilla ulvae]
MPPVVLLFLLLGWVFLLDSQFWRKGERGVCEIRCRQNALGDRLERLPLSTKVPFGECGDDETGAVFPGDALKGSPTLLLRCDRESVAKRLGKATPSPWVLCPPPQKKKGPVRFCRVGSERTRRSMAACSVVSEWRQRRGALERADHVSVLRRVEVAVEVEVDRFGDETHRTVP